MTLPLLSVAEVRKRQKGRTRITSKHQITLPLAAMEASGLAAGETVVVRSDGAGRLVVERESDPFEDLFGSGSGMYPSGYLDELRDEWER